VSLTAKDVDEIMKLLEESRFDSLTLEIDGMKLSLQRGAAASKPVRSATAAPATMSQMHSAPHPKGKARPPSEPGLLDVEAPLLGVFYRAPKPGAEPFVEIGAEVDAETVIGIIEVMKLMNTVRAGVAGEVVEILGENGALVEYGETLIRVRPLS
jgi:acetyl-CoA carboxylase biotin carboxyl carrier protein